MEEREAVEKWARSSNIGDLLPVLLEEGFTTVESIALIEESEAPILFPKLGDRKRLRLAVQKAILLVSPPKEENGPDGERPSPERSEKGSQGSRHLPTEDEKSPICSSTTQDQVNHKLEMPTSFLHAFQTSQTVGSREGLESDKIINDLCSFVKEALASEWSQPLVNSGTRTQLSSLGLFDEEGLWCGPQCESNVTGIVNGAVLLEDALDYVDQVHDVMLTSAPYTCSALAAMWDTIKDSSASASSDWGEFLKQVSRNCFFVVSKLVVVERLSRVVEKEPHVMQHIIRYMEKRMHGILAIERKSQLAEFNFVNLVTAFYATARTFSGSSQGRAGGLDCAAFSLSILEATVHEWDMSNEMSSTQLLGFGLSSAIRASSGIWEWGDASGTQRCQNDSKTSASDDKTRIGKPYWRESSQFRYPCKDLPDIYTSWFSELLLRACRSYKNTSSWMTGIGLLLNPYTLDSQNDSPSEYFFRRLLSLTLGMCSTALLPGHGTSSSAASFTGYKFLSRPLQTMQELNLEYFVSKCSPHLLSSLQALQSWPGYKAQLKQVEMKGELHGHDAALQRLQSTFSWNEVSLINLRELCTDTISETVNNDLQSMFSNVQYLKAARDAVGRGLLQCPIVIGIGNVLSVYPCRIETWGTALGEAVRRGVALNTLAMAMMKNPSKDHDFQRLSSLPYFERLQNIVSAWAIGNNCRRTEKFHSWIAHLSSVMLADRGDSQPNAEAVKEMEPSILQLLHSVMYGHSHITNQCKVRRDWEDQVRQVLADALTAIVVIRQLSALDFTYSMDFPLLFMNAILPYIVPAVAEFTGSPDFHARLLMCRQAHSQYMAEITLPQTACPSANGFVDAAKKIMAILRDNLERCTMRVKQVTEIALRDDASLPHIQSNAELRAESFTQWELSVEEVKYYDERYGPKGLSAEEVVQSSSLGDALVRRCERAPHQNILLWAGKEGKPKMVLSPASLLMDSLHTIRSMQAKCPSLEKGSHVAFCFLPGLEFVIAYFACAIAGYVPVPMYPPNPLDVITSLQRFTALVVEGKCKLILSHKKFHKVKMMIDMNLAKKGFRKGKSAAWPKNIKWVDTDVGTTKRNIYGDKWREKTVTQDIRDAILHARSLNRDVRREDKLFVQFTSGSTNDPKGVVITNGNMLRTVAVSTPYCDVGIGWAPQYHDLGMVATLTAILMARFAVGISPLNFLRSPSLWAHLVSTYRATCTAGPNFSFGLASKRTTEEEKSKLDLSHLRITGNGGEVCRSTTIRQMQSAFADCGLRVETMSPCYGMAESTLTITLADCRQPTRALRIDLGAYARNEVSVLQEFYLATPGDPEFALYGSPASAKQIAWKEVVSCGPTMQGEVVAVDPDSCARLEEGWVGELWVRSPRVGAEYFGKAEKTTETFRAQIKGEEHLGLRYLRTGDKGFMWRGEVYVSGRIKDMLIIGGENYYSNDLEEPVESAHSRLRPGCVAVFSMETEEEEEVAICIAELRTPNGTSEDFRVITDTIQAAVREVAHISFYRILLVPQKTLSKTTSGKIRRAYVREQYVKGEIKALYEAHRDPNSSAPRESRMTAEDAIAPFREGYMKCTTKEERVSFIRERILLHVQRLCGTTINCEDSFLEQGLSSMAAVEITEVLEADLASVNVRVSAAAMFDHTSVNALALHLVSLPLQTSSNARSLTEKSLVPDFAAVVDKKKNMGESKITLSRQRQQATTVQHNPCHSQLPSVCIIGMSFRGPSIYTLDDFWESMMEQQEVVGRAFPPHVPNVRILKIESMCDDIVREQVEQWEPFLLLVDIILDCIESSGESVQSLRVAKAGMHYGGPPPAILKEKLSLSNFIATVLGLRGAASDHDLLCASTFEAIHTACMSIQCSVTKSDKMALVFSSSHESMCPHQRDAFKRANILSPSRTASPLGRGRDGTVPGECAGALLLANGEWAVTQRKAILGRVLGTALGRARQYGTHHPDDQKEVLEEVLQSAGVGVDQVGCVEMCGLGTVMGDTFELAAVCEILESRSSDLPPVRVGLHTRTFGHCGNASGILSVCKAVLMLQHMTVPPNLLDYELCSDANRLQGIPATVTATAEKIGEACPVSLVHCYAAYGSIASSALGTPQSLPPSCTIPKPVCIQNSEDTQASVEVAQIMRSREACGVRATDGEVNGATLINAFEQATGRGWPFSHNEDEILSLPIASLNMSSVDMVRLRNYLQEELCLMIPAASLLELGEQNIGVLKTIIRNAPKDKFKGSMRSPSPGPKPREQATAQTPHSHSPSSTNPSPPPSPTSIRKALRSPDQSKKRKKSSSFKRLSMLGRSPAPTEQEGPRLHGSMLDLDDSDSESRLLSRKARHREKRNSSLTSQDSTDVPTKTSSMVRLSPMRRSPSPQRRRGHSRTTRSPPDIIGTLEERDGVESRSLPERKGVLEEVKSRELSGNRKPSITDLLTSKKTNRGPPSSDSSSPLPQTTEYRDASSSSRPGVQRKEGSFVASTSGRTSSPQAGWSRGTSPVRTSHRQEDDVPSGKESPLGNRRMYSLQSTSFPPPSNAARERGPEK